MMSGQFRERDFPAPGSDDERQEFAHLNAKLPDIYRRLASDRNAPHTTLIVPSLSMDASELAKVKGHQHYEERLLCLLMLLKRPRTRIVFVSSTRIHPIITQYYLNFLVGVPFGHAARRLTMMDTGDLSSRPLSQKILDSPWLLDRIRKSIHDADKAHMVVFNTSPLERTLGVRLGIPVYGTNPDHHHFGSKSGCRRIFEEAGIPVPRGTGDLKNTEDIVHGLDLLWQDERPVRRAVVKLNDGFAGQGNAMFDFRPLESHRGADETTRKRLLEQALFDLKFEAVGETWPNFRSQFEKLEGIVEEFIEGDDKYSPSVQARVNAIGQPQVISTHDQIMGGPTGQMFLGCTFPARKSYRLILQEDGRRAAEVLATKGVMGRFAIDFILVRRPEGGYDRYAIEINLRRGGTTHPFLMMKFLIEGGYDEQRGLYLSSAGEEKYYLATDNLVDPRYIGMGPDDLIDVAVFNNLHFHSQQQRGVAFHMIGALTQFGKLGITCIGNSMSETQEFHQRTIEVLNREAETEFRNERLRFYLRAPSSVGEVVF